MTAEYIYKAVKACEKVHGTRDPEKIFAQMKTVIKRSTPSGLRAMICMIGGRLMVCADGEQTDAMFRVSLAHLLGHAVLHRERIVGGESFEDIYYFGAKTGAEREADIFAAEILITDEEIKELCSMGYTEGQLSASFGGMKELVAFKLFSMRARGIAVCGDVCRADFMKRCDVELFF